MRRCVYPRRGRGLTEGVTARAVGAVAHLRSAYRWMADDVDAQSDDDGGRCGNPMGDGGRWVRQPPKDGCIIVAPGWLAYLGLVVERKNKI